ncbi:MAG: hypothetical protein GF383_14405 [Candidatus Lokiarchaeota archaeon]|nr:hypothetical protein [Candidatus Lokiarchaeota archaeon]MBD3342582.1 hypothetical protein [Candidatus Lokiarchaeota archaeon]
MISLLMVLILFLPGVILLFFASDLAVTNSAKLASALGVSNLIIGVTLVSIGTDISEIVNSIVSCAMGHGDIDVGDSVGSDLAQLTLVFGLLPLFCGMFYIRKREFIIIGACEILSLILIFTVVEKGYFTRLDALFMIACFFLYTILIYQVTKESVLERVKFMEITENLKSKKYHLGMAIIGFLGVTLSAFMIINSIILLSEILKIHEFILSFFILGVATSLPELAVEINAIKQKEYDLAIGDVLGSCIVDSTISIAIGQLLFPQEVSAEVAIPTILYTLFASLIVIVVIAARGKIDRKAGILFISLYFMSYFVIFYQVINIF